MQSKKTKVILRPFVLRQSTIHTCVELGINGVAHEDGAL